MEAAAVVRMGILWVAEDIVAAEAGGAHEPRDAVRVADGTAQLSMKDCGNAAYGEVATDLPSLAGSAIP